jgi:uncharacterized 2Fe-2S/4Fe-4S cluster protein (DUF4445 family)
LSTPQRTQVEGQDVRVTPDPPVKCLEVAVEPPAADRLRADDERLRDALSLQHHVAKVTMDTGALRSLSPLLREQNWTVEVCLRGEECISVRIPGRPVLGLAVDLGTTKIAGYLVDLETGHTLVSQGVMNPQIAYGEDLIARITRTLGSPVEAKLMQRIILAALNGLAEDLCSRVNSQTSDILEEVVVGNTAMHHLLLRLPTEQLVMAPYVPAVAHALDVRARDLQLSLAAGAYVHFLPNVAAFVGADHVAMILGTQLWRRDDTALALDIGTNTEICLAHGGRLSSVSCASGPAFEGAHIRHGMRAAAGAIEHLSYRDNELEYQTIDDVPAVGLCGSGILDALAQLHLAGVVDRHGRMQEHPRVRNADGQLEFVFLDERERDGGPAITITQRDIRELQLAKGAIRAGIQVLLQAENLKEDDLDEVLIAGAFGSYISIDSAIAIGMLPGLPMHRYRQVGNAAGTGARLTLLSREQRREAWSIASRVKYIELASVAGFETLFAASTYLGEYHVT